MTEHRPQDTFLTIAEVAERLKVNQQTVRNWIDQGRLGAIRVGRRIRIRQPDFDRFTGVDGNNVRALAKENPARQLVERPLSRTAASDAGNRFFGAAVDVVRALVRDSSAELAPALRTLAKRAERWADTLER